MKLYISGPMSGIKDYNYPAFNEAAAILRINGHKTYNPAEIGVPRYPLSNDKSLWVYYMKEAIRLLLKADSIVMLPGWKKSKGAKTERWIAKILEYKVYELSDLHIIY